jgi:hypothetical protein
MLVWEVMLNGFEEFYYYHDQDHVLHQIDYVKTGSAKIPKFPVSIRIDARIVRYR